MVVPGRRGQGGSPWCTCGSSPMYHNIRLARIIGLTAGYHRPIGIISAEYRCHRCGLIPSCGYHGGVATNVFERLREGTMLRKQIIGAPAATPAPTPGEID